MENLILEWQKRQQKYEELADKYKDDAHNNRKFTYKAMATRDCWKELALQLLQTDVSKSVCNYCLEFVDELPDKFGCKDCIEKYK